MKKIKKIYYRGKIFTDTRGFGLRYRITCFFNDIEEAWQRAKNGYSRCDTWDIDCWFLDTLPHMLGDMIEHAHGYPGFGEADTYEKWIAILKRMKFCFEEAKEETCSQKNEWEGTYDSELIRISEIPHPSYQVKFNPEENWQKYSEREKELEEYRLKMFNEGIDLFKTWFFQLWD